MYVCVVVVNHLGCFFHKEYLITLAAIKNNMFVSVIVRKTQVPFLI